MSSDIHSAKVGIDYHVFIKSTFTPYLMHMLARLWKCTPHRDWSEFIITWSALLNTFEVSEAVDLFVVMSICPKIINTRSGLQID